MKMEIVKEEELCRFAVIDMFDIILWDSNNVLECYNFYINIGKEFCKGIYDYQNSRYLDEIDIIDLTGVTLHCEGE